MQQRTNFSKSCLTVFILLSIFFYSQVLEAQQATVFCIQIGVFKDNPEKELQSINETNLVFTEKTKNQHYRVLVGRYASKNAAKMDLNLIKQKGFKDAFIVSRNADSLPTIYDALYKTEEEKESLAKPNEIYVIQLAAYAAKIPKDTFKPLNSCGGIYTEKTTSLTKVYLGYYTTQKDAKTALVCAKEGGFNKAFLKTIAPERLNLFIPAPRAVGRVDNSYTPIDMGNFNFYELNDGSDSLELSIKLFPISPNELLLRANLKPSNAMYSYPALLYSDNGGESWRNVLPATEYGTYIEYINFVEKYVYIVTFHAVEGPGDLVLYESADGGKTWTTVGQIPKNEHYCVPLYLKFNDKLNGTVVYECDKLQLWSTTNGGKTWIDRGVIAKDAFGYMDKTSPIEKDGIYQSLEGRVPFKLIAKDRYIGVYQQDTKTQKWKEISKIAQWYKLEDKQVVAF